MTTNALADSMREIRGRGKRAVARLARKVLPGTTLTLTHVEPGLTLTVNLRRHVMFWSGGLAKFEPFAVRALRAAVLPGDLVYDVGANIGFFSTLFARWVGEAGAVVSFEPEPENLAQLRENLAANGAGHVTVVPSAVGAVSGTAPFSLDDATGSTGHLGGEPTAGEQAVGSGRLRVIETPVTTIDDEVARRGAAPAVIKLDIEGYEILALGGGLKTLTEARPLVVAELAGDEGWKVIEYLDDRGYALWDLESRRPVAPGEHPFMVVAIPREATDTDRARRVLETLQG